MQERRREIAEILYFADDYVKMKPLLLCKKIEKTLILK